MGYVIPQLQALFDNVEQIRKDYLAQKTTPNPDRLQLIDTLTVIVELIRQASLANPRPTELELQQICLGVYVFCFERIAKQYHALNPSFSEGYIFNSGSKLYKLLLQHLGITQENQINHQQKLIFLSKFYRFVCGCDEAALTQALREKNSDLTELKHHIRELIKSVFHYNKKDANKLIKAIPAEVVIDHKMSQMVDEYLGTTSANNPERKFLAQLVKAMSQVIPIANDEEDRKHFLSRRQRVKMGFLLYIMQAIWDTYYVRSPKGNSALYDLSRGALNIEQLGDMDTNTRLACLSAFETFITDSQNVAELESELGHTYIDSNIHVMRKKVDVMIEAIHVSIPEYNVSGFAVTCAVLGAMITAAPGYGTGYVLGYTLSQTDGLVGTKLAIAKVTDFTLTLILGKAGNYLGYYASNMLIDATLERGFAKVFEALGMLAGAATGGLIGIVIYDLSYRTLRNLCDLYMDLHTKLSPNLAKDVDPQYVECLLALPEDVFPQERKEKVKSITSIGIFAANADGGVPHEQLGAVQEDRLALNVSH